MSRQVVAVVVAILALSQSEVVHADPLADAEAAVAAGELAKAASIIEAGLVEEPRDLKLLFLRGKVELQRRRFASAVAAYEAYLAAGPRGANARKAKKIIDNLAAVKTTFLEVSVSGGAADVYLDDKSLGVYCVANSVCTVGMMPGRYRLFIERQGGGAQVTRDVVVAGGQKARVEVELAAPKTPLTVRVVPPDAEVSVDGAVVGTGERTVGLTAGRHEVSVRRAGFEPVTRAVVIEPGQTAVVDVALPERVPVAGLPAGVAVAFELDGAPITLSGNAVPIPSDGREHRLVARAAGYSDAAVSVRAGRDGAPVVISMTRAPVDSGPETAGGWSGARKATLIGLLAAGGLGVGLGSVFGLQAIGKRDDADAFCNEQTCSQEGLDLLDESRSRATVSNVAFGVGLAAIVGAGVVWLTAPEAESNAAQVGAAVGPNSAQISVKVGF